MWGRLQLKLSCCEIFIVGGSKSSFFKLLLNIGMASQTKLVWEGKEAVAVMGRRFGVRQGGQAVWSEGGGQEVSQGVLPPPQLPVLLAKAGCKTSAAPARGACLLGATFSCQFWTYLFNLAANLSEPRPVCWLDIYRYMELMKADSFWYNINNFEINTGMLKGFF